MTDAAHESPHLRSPFGLTSLPLFVCCDGPNAGDHGFAVCIYRDLSKEMQLAHPSTYMSGQCVDDASIFDADSAFLIAA